MLASEHNSGLILAFHAASKARYHSITIHGSTVTATTVVFTDFETEYCSINAHQAQCNWWNVEGQWFGKEELFARRVSSSPDRECAGRLNL